MAATNNVVGSRIGAPLTKFLKVSLLRAIKKRNKLPPKSQIFENAKTWPPETSDVDAPKRLALTHAALGGITDTEIGVVFCKKTSFSSRLTRTLTCSCGLKILRIARFGKNQKKT